MRGPGKRDQKRTAARRFTDPRSYVSTLGTEWLYGRDMAARRAEVWRRDGKRCAHCAVWLRYTDMHLHHILPRSRGGDDSLCNLVTLCVRCHQACHRKGT